MEKVTHVYDAFEPNDTASIRTVDDDGTVRRYDLSVVTDVYGPQLRITLVRESK